MAQSSGQPARSYGVTHRLEDTKALRDLQIVAHSRKPADPDAKDHIVSTLQGLGTIECRRDLQAAARLGGDALAGAGQQAKCIGVNIMKNEFGAEERLSQRDIGDDLWRPLDAAAANESDLCQGSSLLMGTESARWPK